MAVLTGRIRTRKECEALISEKMKALAKVRQKLKKDNTMHVRAALKGEENELASDIKKLKAHQNTLRK